MTPEDGKSLNELERATSVAPSTLVFVSIEDSTSESGFSTRAMTIELLAEELLKRMQFGDLETVTKTIIEAINEASQGGGSGGVSKNYVDSQDEAVKNDLVNGYTTQNYLDDYYLGKNGLEARSVGFVVSTPIYLNGKRVVTWYVGNDSTICLCAYRADGSFIDYFTGNVNVRTINFDDFSETRDVEIAFIKASFIKNKLVDGYNKIEDSNGAILYEVSEGVSINGLINHEVRIEALENGGGGGGGSTVTIADNPAGGVDLTVDGTTKTLASEEDLRTTKADLLSLDSRKQDNLVNNENIYNINDWSRLIRYTAQCTLSEDSFSIMRHNTVSNTFVVYKEISEIGKYYLNISNVENSLGANVVSFGGFKVAPTVYNAPFDVEVRTDLIDFQNDENKVVTIDIDDTDIKYIALRITVTSSQSDYVTGNIFISDKEIISNDDVYNISVKDGKVSLVRTLNDKISNLGLLPKYYLDEVEKVKNDVLSDLPFDSVVFGIVTDLHYSKDGDSAERVNDRQISALRKISDSLPLDFSVNGGDLLTYCNHQYSVSVINDSLSAFSGCRVPHFIAKGDHDSAQEDDKISKTEWAARTYPYMPNIVRCETYKNNYYYDVPNKKTRFVVLDSGTGMAGQSEEDFTSDLVMVYSWLINDVFSDDVKNEWKFIFFSHAPHDYEWNVGMVKRGALSAVRKTQIVLLDLLDALNNSSIFHQDYIDSQTRLTVYRDENGVLTQDTSKTEETYTLGTFRNALDKDFTEWTSKAKLIVSGHCHCDRLNNISNGIVHSYGIAYTGAGSYSGFKDEEEYYKPCFGEDGLVASWNNIRNRNIGEITEALVDIYIVSNDKIRTVRFGVGANKELYLN